MKRPEWSQRLLKLTAQRWRRLLVSERNPEWPPPPLIQNFTDMIYSGNKKAAFDCLDRAWPSPLLGKDEFLRTYQEALKESLYYGEFEKTLQL